MYTPRRSLHGSRGEPTSASVFSSPATVDTRSATRDQESSPFTRRKLITSGQQQVLEHAPTHKLLTFGFTLPVQVAEVIANDSVSISSKIDSFGWAWIIHSRKVLIWRSVKTASRRAATCFELPLSFTDLNHSADLSCIVSTNQESAIANTSFVNVSPEGILRTWMNISRASAFTETNLNLDGKKCHKLSIISSSALVLTTTTNEVLLISLLPSVTCRPLLPPSGGMLAGLGRRVSSFWSAPIPSTQTSRFPASVIVCSAHAETNDCHLFVISGETLQKWEVSFTGPKLVEKFLFEVDLLSVLESRLRSASPGCGAFEVVSAELYCSNIAILLSVTEEESDGDQLILTNISVSADGEVSVEKVVPLPMANTDVKMITCPSSYQLSVCSQDEIISMSLNDDQPVNVRFNATENRILGCGAYSQDHLFLSKRHGLITLKLEDSKKIVCDEELKIPMDEAQETTKRTFEVNKASDTSESDDVYRCLRNAFLAYTSGAKVSIPAVSLDDGDFVKAVILIGLELIDGKPASDPRWLTTNFTSINTSSSVLIGKQIQDKEDIYNLFLKFLKENNICMKDEHNFVKAKLIEHAEKVQVALALQELYAKHEQLLQGALFNCLNDKSINRDEEPNLNDQDIFFCKISEVDGLFPALLIDEKDLLKTMQSINDQIELIRAVSDIIIISFNSAWHYRQAMFEEYALDVCVTTPWTGSSTGKNCRQVLSEQIKIVLETALPNVDSTKVGTALSQQVLLLADLLLDGLKTELNSSQFGESQDQNKVNEEYINERKAIISSLVNLGYSEQACKLAETYEDFEMLISICEKTHNPEKLNGYKVMFADQGFLDTLYNWYMKQGEWGKLMANDSSDKLSSFLSNHHELSWLHSINKNDFSKSSTTLKDIGMKENKYVTRKKTLLVLAKLSLLASDEPQESFDDKMTAIDEDLEIIECQEKLPPPVLDKYSRDSSSPMSPQQLIQLYIEDEQATDSNFITALRLLKFVETADKWELNQKIWSTSLLYNQWDPVTQIDPVALINDKMLYKCLCVMENQGMDKESIPRLSEILKHAPPYLHSNDILHQMKICYELAGASHLTDDL